MCRSRHSVPSRGMDRFRVPKGVVRVDSRKGEGCRRFERDGG